MNEAILAGCSFVSVCRSVHLYGEDAGDTLSGGRLPAAVSWPIHSPLAQAWWLLRPCQQAGSAHTAPVWFVAQNRRPAHACRGILFYGEPGTGKTLTARALAGSIARRSPRPVAFFSRKGADCLGKFSGEAERTLRLLFEEVRLQSAAAHWPEALTHHSLLSWPATTHIPAAACPCCALK